jgi:hypothetical protein
MCTHDDVVSQYVYTCTYNYNDLENDENTSTQVERGNTRAARQALLVRFLLDSEGDVRTKERQTLRQTYYYVMS